MLPLIYFLFGFLTIPYLIPLKGEVQDFSKKPFPESRFYERNGLKVHFREWNKESNRTVVLISGFGGSTYSWRNLLPDLEKNGYHVIAVDPPPFGYSSKEPGYNHSVTYNGSLTWGLLKSTQTDSCILVGHSMGGAIVAAMADTLPGNVKAAVYIDGGNFTKSVEIRLFRFPPLQRWAEIIGHYCLFDEDRFSSIIRSAFGREPEEEEVRQILKPFLYRNSAASVLDVAASADTRELDGKFRDIPSLVIWGDKDTWLNQKFGERFYSKLCCARIKIINGSGHCPMETNYPEFREHFFTYLDSIN